jgi:hypothetical protein
MWRMKDSSFQPARRYFACVKSRFEQIQANPLYKRRARCHPDLQMNTQTADSNTLLRARTQLEAVLRQQESSDPRGVDTGTLSRMLVHMDNIAKSVSASKDDHVNASKRLNDFANTVERMARIAAQPGTPRVGDPMTALVESLRSAGRELSNAGDPPSWARTPGG